jgi:hypothetical protein
VFFAKVRDSESCRELKTEIFRAYLPLGVFIISLKFHLKTPIGLGDPSIESWELFRELFSGLSRR